MANKVKKIVGLAMAAILCTANVLPALAEEVPAPAPAPAASEPAPAPAPAPVSEPAPAAETKTETKTETDKASGEQLTVTTTTTVEEGKKTVTVTWTNEESSGSESEGSGSEGSGSEAPAEPKKELIIEGEQTTTTETKGSFTTTEVNGEETRTEITEDEGNEPGQPEVKVEIIPGETTSNFAGETTVSGDVPTGENDLNYDYTETTTIEREVTVEASDVETTYNDVDTGLVENQDTELKGLSPVYDVIDGVKEDKGGMFDNQFNNCLNNKYADPSKWTGENAMPEEADVRFLGTGEHTMYYASFVYAVYEKDEAGNTVYDENGKPVIKELWNRDPKVYSDAKLITLNGEPTTELPDDFYGMPEYDNNGGNRPTLHALKDQNGNVLYGYCADNMVATHAGSWYSMTNLEDSDYYASEDAEKHIRSIALNGYWGTSDIPKEDGTYEIGSIEFLKQKLKDAINNGELENSVVSYTKKNTDGSIYYDENGNTVTEQKTMLEIIDGLTPGEALIATEAAIWSYSNGSIAAQNGQDGYLIIDPDYKANHKAGNSKGTVDILDDYGGARIDLLYDWLINLDTEEESTIIINDKNFVEDVSLTVKDKDMSHKDSNDNNKDNDVYNTDINFKLAFIPGEKDDLLVQITYTDLDGNNVNLVRRLAGEAKEGETYGSINPDDDGNYVISGLKLSENDPFDFDLRLEGTQYLENGVYIYECTAGREDNQNFVGVATGERNVDVSMGITVKFDVDEDNKVVAERKWHKKTTKSNKKPGGSTPGGNVPGNDATIISDDPVPLSGDPAEEALEVILDEEVPLAAAPETGDNSIIFAIMSMMSLMGMAILGKKRVKE